MRAEYFLRMTILQKITTSKDPSVFTLYREGMFYKCYNEDAMVFHQRVKDFKITSKFIKRAGSVVLSLGFPQNIIEKGTVTIKGIEEAMGAVSWSEEPHGVVFQLSKEIKMGYDAFQEVMQVAREPVNSLKTTTNDTSYQKLIEKIRNYNLANQTPMQGMAFIQELKDDIMKEEL